MHRVHRVASEASSSASTISSSQEQHEQHEQPQHPSQRRRLDETVAFASSAFRIAIHPSPPPISRHHAADPQGATTASLFARLPADLCVGIVDHLDVFAIRELSVVSREWFARANSDRVWKRVCVERWRGKRHHPDVDSVIDRFPRRPLITPIQRGFTTASAIVSATASASIPPSSASSSASISYPSASRDDGSARTPTDAGTLFSNSWRRAYEFAELDRHRADMTPDELFSLHWLFIFKGDSHSVPVRIRFALIDRGTDGVDLAEVMISDQWEEMPWRWAALGDGGLVGIQVAEYPTLLLSREPDSWAWRMENEFVYFFEHTLPLDASDDEIYAFAQSRRDPDEAEIIWIDEDDDDDEEDDDDFDGGDDDVDVDDDFDQVDGGDDDDDFDGAEAEEDADDFGV